MTDTNPTVHPGQPDENNEAVMKPDAASNYPEPDIFDYFDEAAAQITDAEIEERLRRTLHRAGYKHAGPCTDATVPEDGIQDFGAIGRIMSSDGEIADAIDEALNNRTYLSCVDGTSRKGDLHLVLNLADLQQADRIMPAARRQWWLLQSAREEVRAAHQEAEQIISAASERSDQALSEAAKIVRDARNQAQQIISDAHREAERIRETAKSQAAESQATASAVAELHRLVMLDERHQTCTFGQQVERTPVTSRDAVRAALSVLPDLAAVLPETYLSALSILGAIVGTTVSEAFKLSSLAETGLAGRSIGEQTIRFRKEVLEGLLTGTDRETLRAVLKRVYANDLSETLWEERAPLSITSGNGIIDSQCTCRPESVWRIHGQIHGMIVVFRARDEVLGRCLELECGEDETDTSVSDSLTRH